MGNDKCPISSPLPKVDNPLNCHETEDEECNGRDPKRGSIGKIDNESINWLRPPPPTCPPPSYEEVFPAGYDNNTKEESGFSAPTETKI